ncbi:serine/threonine-protein kinase [Plantactinospora sp. KLBMP9567]|uniref:serine/threonine-protein kinase n=1 Tax=Plantactinospora sp. KLBMP9567 TaxID=3085900 RepID=UPI002981C38F|nr:serine/threonine-protein kinase [Plantactinospora sp. KLBMP9567]MDW5329051.1 serine/threonine-protein kinase [Plantactinospora sp. KLBMP9567]
MSVLATLKQLGDYRLIRPLGSGGMGDVYFGVSPTADRVAVKVIRQHLLTNPKIRERFATEVESLRVVWGSRVARLEAADPLGDPAWLAVEYVPGSTLSQYVEQRGPLPLPLVAMIGAMLADGLDRVHQAGLLHRDLKPQNIILGRDGPVLIDFGLAVLTERDDYLTDPGAVVGSPHYMSPERIEGERDQGAGSDVYGLAATLVFALTGHQLYAAAGGLPGLLLQIVDPDVLPNLSGVPNEVAPVLGAMLAHDPSARPSLPVVRTRLLAIATSGGVPVIEMRRRVGELTFDGSTEIVVPPEFTDPLQDPEDVAAGDGGSDDGDSDDGDSDDNTGSRVDGGPDTQVDPDPPRRRPTTLVDPEPPDRPRAEVGWLTDRLRQQYARRNTL